MKGKIRSLKTTKNFGFISPERGGAKIFFHHTGLVGIRFPDLKNGDRVTYEIEQTEKGPQAVKVEKV